jgi:hypothetical protein
MLAARSSRLSAWFALRVDRSSPRRLALSVAAGGVASLMWIYGALIHDVAWNDGAALRDPSVTFWFIAHRRRSLGDGRARRRGLGAALVIIAGGGGHVGSWSRRRPSNG